MDSGEQTHKHTTRRVPVVPGGWVVARTPEWDRQWNSYWAPFSSLTHVRNLTWASTLRSNLCQDNFLLTYLEWLDLVKAHALSSQLTVAQSFSEQNGSLPESRVLFCPSSSKPSIVHVCQHLHELLRMWKWLSSLPHPRLGLYQTALIWLVLLSLSKQIIPDAII